jgi:hypothetical protein
MLEEEDAEPASLSAPVTLGEPDAATMLMMLEVQSVSLVMVVWKLVRCSEQ